MKRNLLLLALFCVGAVYGQNPVFTHLYTADPSAHVWKGDNRLWLYTSHDEPGLIHIIQCRIIMFFQQQTL